jgi:phosphomethylpyrimidine synthase
MSTLIDDLKHNKTYDFISSIAQDEGIPEQNLVSDLLNGQTVIPRNNQHNGLSPIAIGKNTRIKINANIGTSPVHCDFDYEIQKGKIAIQSGADTIMDLSIAGNVSELRRRIINELDVTLGTVPIYEAMIGLKDPTGLDINKFLKVIELQAKEKVDFMTIHAGVLRKHLPLLNKRVLGIVSRGGSILVHWMQHYNQENFAYQYFDKILEIANEYDITLSLGDGLRPGCTADANDEAQFGELETLGELVERCKAANVQVMVEGPGHVPIQLIKENIVKQKMICKGAPFYVLGPLVIDYAAGYDHIAGAIGGALAAFYGADFLCYVTPAEHLRLPTVEDVREGVVASKIAAAAVDLANNKPAEMKRNLEISRARKNFDWELQEKLAIDQNKFHTYFERVNCTEKEITCSMCGEWCAIRRTKK